MENRLGQVLKKLRQKGMYYMTIVIISNNK